MNARVPPHDLDAEAALIGSAIVDPSILQQPWADLGRNHFYKEGHGKIWASIQRIAERGMPPDLVVVADDLQARGELEEIGGHSYLIALFDSTSTAAYAEHYAEIIRRKTALRDLIHISGEVIKKAYEEVDLPEAILAGLEADLTRFATGQRERGPIDYYKEAELILNGQVGAPTGFVDLDKFTGGLTTPGLNIIAARPSMGKTSLARQIVRNWVKRNERVFWASYDQAGGQIYLLEAAARAHVPVTLLRNQTATQNQQDRVRQALWEISQLYGSFVRLLDLPAPLERLISQARSAVRSGASLIVVDYLQLVDAKGEGETEQASRVSKAMKGLALECGVPVIGVAQLSRAAEARQDKRPVLSDLRQSGQLEQDADQVWMLYRDEYYNPHTKDKGIAEVLIRKHKTGPTGMQKLAWVADLAEFKNLATPAHGGNQGATP